MVAEEGLMPRDEPGLDDAPTEAQLRELASSIDSAAEDLAANGPVRPMSCGACSWIWSRVGRRRVPPPAQRDRRIARSTR
jgi:hypothetical protein